MSAKRREKRITDKERLDWIFKNWFGSRSGNSPWRMELTIQGDERSWPGSKSGPYFRQAIDAAIRATRRHRRKP